MKILHLGKLCPPIITKETTISTGSEIWIEDLTINEIKTAVDKALNLSQEQIKICKQEI